MLKLPEIVPEQPRGWIFRFVPLAFQYLIPPVYRILAKSWRHQNVGIKNFRKACVKDGVIAVTWHGNMLIPAYVIRDRGWHALVSPVWEGELLARLFSGLGLRFIRASSGYSPSAGIRKCVRKLREKETIILIIDGPEGPAKEIKPGVISIAALSGRPIVPTIGIASPCLHLPTWDKQDIPIPFARTEFRVGKPIYVPRVINEEIVHKYSVILRNSLLKLENEAKLSLQYYK